MKGKLKRADRYRLETASIGFIHGIWWLRISCIYEIKQEGKGKREKGKR